MKKLFYVACILSCNLLIAQSDNLDSLFDDPSSSVIEEAAVVKNPEAAVFENQTFLWGGDFDSTIGVKGSYSPLLPTFEQLQSPRESLLFDLKARLWFDARPDKNYRVFGKLTTAYPFTTQIDTLADPSSAPDAVLNPVTSYTVNNIKLFELFTDFNWDETVFFRFGKQTTAWGLSRFYQIADPLTVGVKNPNDLTLDLEGPLALKVALPLGVHNLYFYSVVKESYLPKDMNTASISDVGVGVKADFLVTVPKNAILGNAEFTLGTYYQRKLAPKAIAGLSTSIGKLQLFTDQAFSWGLDSYRLYESSPGVYSSEKPGFGIFYSATAGTMYVNNDWHFTFYGEYMYNSAASTDPEYLKKFLANLGYLNLTASDLFGYLSQHNSALSLSWSELFNTDKVSFSAVWLQNWVDMSGMATPSITFTPFDHLSLQTGVTVAWGTDTSEWILKNSNITVAPMTLTPRRISPFISAKIGGGKF